MVNSYAVITSLLALLIDCPVNAFIPVNLPSITNTVGAQTSRSATTAIEATPQPDKYSDAFTAYMTKSHEEKLKAVKVAEDKKNAEIKALKKELDGMKSGVISTVSEIESVEGSTEEISAKLAAYQQFMSQYIVRAQEEKYKAVKAAEDVISKKYEGKLNAFMLNPVDASSLTVPGEAKSSETYDKRSATVAASGEAGKSRWGVEEVQRMSSSAK